MQHMQIRRDEIGTLMEGFRSMEALQSETASWKRFNLSRTRARFEKKIGSLRLHQITRETERERDRERERRSRRHDNESERSDALGVETDGIGIVYEGGDVVAGLEIRVAELLLAHGALQALVRVHVLHAGLDAAAWLPDRHQQRQVVVQRQRLARLCPRSFDDNAR
jgi:hypothetical protein